MDVEPCRGDTICQSRVISNAKRGDHDFCQIQPLGILCPKPVAMNRTPKPDRIRIKDLSRQAISHLRGILKRKSGGKPFGEKWAEHKAAERKLEARCPGIDHAGTAE